MVNIWAREFLYNNFPTQEDKAKVKLLEVYPNNDRGYMSSQSSNSGCYYFVDTWLTGELDISDFVNLETLLLKGQTQITLKGWEELEKLVDVEIDSHLHSSLFSVREFLSLKHKIRQVEKENQELRELEEVWFKEANLEKKIEIRSSKLKRMKANYERKIGNEIYFSFLETLLISQEQIKRLGEENNSQIMALSERQFSRAKGKLSEKLSEEEINQICQLQTEITKLEIEAEKFQEQLEAKIEII